MLFALVVTKVVYFQAYQHLELAAWPEWINNIQVK
jgi:hypothetical protein